MAVYTKEIYAMVDNVRVNMEEFTDNGELADFIELLKPNDPTFIKTAKVDRLKFDQ